jgi:hypothetical protein
MAKFIQKIIMTHNLPTTHADWVKDWQANHQSHINAYIASDRNFLPMLPEIALKLTVQQIFSILSQKLGSDTLNDILSPHVEVESPVAHTENAAWIQRSNMVGINVRTIGNFWNIIKYALTLPDSQDCVHLLPIWEPGVVASLYGIASWNINPEFFSHELQGAVPNLNTVEKQLRVVVNILHALGKTVGMDVIPHTDRFSEIVLANPWYFEWLQRVDKKITNHSSNLHKEVELHIFSFLKRESITNAAIQIPNTADAFFDNAQFSEAQRVLFLFGEKRNQALRFARRDRLIQHLYDLGFEPAPATMGPPYRGLDVDTAETAKTVDEAGRVWRDFAITKPEKFSRAFGPLTRFKLYDSKDDNRNWEIDFSKPRIPVWQYVAEQYAKIAEEYNFDFMRGDMSHVQMRPEGVVNDNDTYYDLLKFIKNFVQQQKPHFGYYAESFLAPAGEMAYGSEPDHLDASDAEVTLGDLQSLVVGTPNFLQQFRWYLDLAATRSFKPCFTMMTGDKDDPRFDSFYVKGNEIRLFIGLFLPDMPSYMALGFECRDTHLIPAPNEHYTKLYVFQIPEGAKSTRSKYIFGKNGHLFSHLTRIRDFADAYIERDANTHWLIAPDATGWHKVIAWMHSDMLFIANLDVENTAKNVKIPLISSEIQAYKPLFSTISNDFKAAGKEISNEKTLKFLSILEDMAAGEGRVYAIKSSTIENVD